MKRTFSIAVFECGQPSRTRLNRPFVQPLAAAAYALLATMNSNDNNNSSSTGDLKSQSLGLSDGELVLESEDGEMACEIYRAPRTHLRGVEDLETCSMKVVRVGSLGRRPEICTECIRVCSVPGVCITTASALAIHSAGANGGST
jgi:hypothetical protein